LAAAAIGGDVVQPAPSSRSAPSSGRAAADISTAVVELNQERVDGELDRGGDRRSVGARWTLVITRGGQDASDESSAVTKSARRTPAIGGGLGARRRRARPRRRSAAT